MFAEQTADFVGVADGWGHILYLNPAARKRLGVAEAGDLTIADVFPLDEFPLYYEVARPQLLRTGAWSGEILVNIAGEGAVPMYASTSAQLGPGGAIVGLVIHARELPRSRPGVPLGWFAVDEETGVFERAAFVELVAEGLAAAHRDDELSALVIVDIIGMRATIDAFGEVAAARVMRSLAGRVTRLARSIDIVGRVGEHRLGLFLRGVRSHGEVSRIADTVRNALVDPPVTTAGGEVVAYVACGVALSTSSDDAAGLMERATAEIAGEPPLREASRPEVSTTMHDFQLGLSRGDVRAYAQPVVDLGSGAVVGYRGLARWHRARLGTVAAADFIEMIADTPLAAQVDLYVARETAAVVTLLLRDSPLRLYVPVSKRFVADVRAEQYVSEIADAFLLSMSQMHLQIARRLLDRASPAFRDALQSLRDAGLPLVLTGVEAAADVEALGDHPFGEVHISRQLTNAVATDAAARRALSRIVRLAHDGGHLVGATGVGDQEHHDLVKDAGCDLASGDLYGPPEPADTID